MSIRSDCSFSIICEEESSFFFHFQELSNFVHAHTIFYNHEIKHNISKLMLQFCIFSVRRYCINWTQLQHFSGGQWLIYKQLFPLFHKYIYVHSLCTDRRLKHKHLFFKFEQVPSYITVRGNLQWTASITTNRFL